MKILLREKKREGGGEKNTEPKHHSNGCAINGLNDAKRWTPRLLVEGAPDSER